MTDTNGIRGGVGIIADRALLRHRLRQTLEQQGFVVSVNIPPEGCRVGLLSSPMVRVWVVDLANDHDYDQLLDDLAEYPKVPVFYDIGLPENSASVEYVRWQRRLGDKLDLFRETDITEPTREHPEPRVVNWPLKSSRTPEQARNHKAAEHVWVLGASLGGSNAVKLFIDTLPENFPCAFVYAQHIDQEFASVLMSTVGRHSDFNIVSAKVGLVLNEGDILFAPIEHRIEFDNKHRLHLVDAPWSGFYSPNIDQVMETVRRSWPSTCGTIIFSGMGKDGCREAGLYKDEQRPVWVQSPESCASSLMPQSVIDEGYASFQGTPQELAEKLIKTIDYQPCQASSATS